MANKKRKTDDSARKPLLQDKTFRVMLAQAHLVNLLDDLRDSRKKEHLILRLADCVARTSGAARKRR